MKGFNLSGLTIQQMVTEVCGMDGLITMMIAPVMMKDQANKEDKKAGRKDYKSKAKKRADENEFKEKYAATYQHDPYAELSGITYKRPRIKGY